MASGGSSVQSAAALRSLYFGSDDVLCSLEYELQSDSTVNGKHLDLSAKDHHENRVISPSANLCGQPKKCSREDATLLHAVEQCVKKFADDVTKHLERLSGRLILVELYCHKLQRIIHDCLGDMIRDQCEADLKLTSLEKLVHEVHRSVQIIRDKQELSEFQEGLTKFLRLHKDSTNLNHSQKNNESLNAAISKNITNNESIDVPKQQSALTLPYQISSPAPSIAITATDKNHPEKELPAPQSLWNHYVLNQVNACYYNQHQPLLVLQQSQNLQPELQYAQQRVKMDDVSVQSPPKQHLNVAASQPTQQLPFPQSQQHWSQPLQPQQPSSRSQPPPFQTPTVYVPYALNHHANTIPEAHQGSSILLSAPYYAAPQPGSYGGSSSTVSHILPQHNMQQQSLPQPSQASFAPPPVAMRGFAGTSTCPSQSPMLGYDSMYVTDGNKASRLESYSPNGNVAASLISSNDPYGDMIEKAVSMGYRRDQLVIVLGTSESF